MDDTQQSRASDAGATRKRRSSILKIQRPPRTPFSELEFNVATPTDTAKSRRVSFSRRTGVAEFVTNEATTTWKNFYEEHNKSLESSGNDSGAHASRQPIGHLGKRIFEQQFEEVEAADFITSLDNLAGRNVNNTMNINFTEQLASLEATDNMKPTAPQNNFELSALTDHHSKIFGDDLAIPTMGEGSGRIDINFSAVQSIDVKDDLDEIQRDIQRQSNVFGPPPFRNARDFSEYIEVELNSTHAVIRTEESDMSITETIPSPKVNVSKTLSPPVKKSSLNWVDDKENKRLDDLEVKAKSLISDDNDMSITKAIPTKLSQESEKRKTIVFEDAFADLSMTKPLPVKLMVEDNTNKRVDSDVRSKSFVGNADMSMTAVIPGKITKEPEKRRTMIFDDDLGDLSMTKALPAKLIEANVKAKPLAFDRNPEMSMTEVLPGKINHEPEKRRTMIFEDDLGDLSMTKPVPAKLLPVQSEPTKKSISNEIPHYSNFMAKESAAEERKTILFDDDLGDLSITKPIPAQMLTTHSEIINKSSLNQNFNKSISQPECNTTEKRKTILFEDDLADLSMTKPIPAKMLSAYSEIMNKSNYNEFDNKSILQPQESTSEKRKTIVFDNDEGDLSMTKPISANMLSAQSEFLNKSNINNKSILQPQESNTYKRRTIVFDEDGDLSMTKPILTKMLSAQSEIMNRSNINDKSILQPQESNTDKRKTIVFDDDGDLSMTKPIPAHMLTALSEIINKSSIHENQNRSNIQSKETTEKRNTILFENDLGDLSMTKPVLANMLSVHSEIINRSNINDFNKSNIQPKEITDKRKTILFEDDLADVSVTKSVSAKLFDHSEIIDKSNLNKTFNRTNIKDEFILRNKEIMLDHVNENVAMINNPTAVEQPTENINEKRKTILFDDGLGDLSMTKPIAAHLKSVHSEMIEKIINRSQIEVLSVSLNVKSKTLVYDRDDHADMSISPTTELPKDTEKHKTILFEDNVGNMSMTRSVPVELLSVHSEVTKTTEQLSTENHNVRTDKRNPVFETEMNDISVTKPIPRNMCDLKTDDFYKTKEDLNKESEMNSIDYSKFKAQDVVIYQVATNETSMAQNTVEQHNPPTPEDKIVEENKIESTKDHSDISMVQDKIEQSDAITVGSSDIKVKEKESIKENVTTNEDYVKTQDESQQVEKEEDLSRNVSVDSVVLNVPVGAKKSLLCSLLDMSNASLVTANENNDVSVKANPEKCESASKTTTTESVGSDIFYITRDTDSESQSNDIKERKSKSIALVDAETNQELSPDESTPNLIDKVQSALSELKNDSSVNSKNFEQVASVDMIDVGVGVTPETSRANVLVSKYPKRISEVDNTKDLLDMLSDLTDGRKSIYNEGLEQHTSFSKSIALENKENVGPKRVSIAPNRQSIVLSREDLLNNISMAQAALQMSIDMEDSDIEEPTPAIAMTPPKKTVRVSNEVVKTLHFEDESSASEVSVKTDSKSPLKKTAFGETSYMKETNKSHVIPSYWKDVSDGIKSLMNDLVKPMADEQPFESVSLGKPLKKNPSTCSTQIQANLVTSSQIDLPTDLLSNTESMNEEKDLITNRMSITPKNPAKSLSFNESDVCMKSDLVSRNLKEASYRPTIDAQESLLPGKILVFDHENPLNNVLLTPAEFTEVHKYNPPGDATESHSGDSERSHSTQCSVREKDEYEVENVSIKYDFTNYHKRNPSGDSGAYKISQNHSATSSNISKPASINRAIDVRVTEVKDIEVNTAIAMKKNKELLEASSSLTLVDDALADPAFDVDLASTHNSSNPKSPLRVIYKLKHDNVVDKADSDFTSTDECEAKPKKRNYSPVSAENQSSSQNVTPKPVNKMQRLSDSPNSRNYTHRNKSLKAERDTSSAESKMDIDISPSKETPKKRSPKKHSLKGVSITVQQLLTEFNVTPELDQKVLSKQILEALSKTDSSAAPESLSEGRKSLEIVSSFTSSKNQCGNRQSTTITRTESSDSKDGWVDKSPVLECDSSVNVVAKIDMLSFMGSHECEWASSGTDSWSFRLLHGRIRLHVKLAHRVHNAARTRVRADTPVTHVSVHTSHHGNDKKNSVAMLCMNFAADAIRAAAEGACTRAGDVPALLRRGAAVARRALRWGRAMHDARLHLAYTLREHARLVLKVANIPLRCVWEVSMRLELCTQPGVMPWPRATDVVVTRVLDNTQVPEDRLHKLLATVPEGWQHAPTTVWRIFKYLKNKTPEDDAMGL